MESVQQLENVLQYTFIDRKLLEEALIHSSLIHNTYTTNHSEESKRSFDRLEFLGDRVLNLLIAEFLYQCFPEESEGDLAKRFTALVCFKTCAEVANEIHLSHFLKVAQGTTFNDLRILCDAIEAIIGAMYLDGGLIPCQRFIQKYWKHKIINSIHPPQDPKSLLQELVQASGKPLPIYEVVEKTGSEHAPIYTVSVQVEGYDLLLGNGNSKKTAEKEAAAKFLKTYSL